MGLKLIDIFKSKNFLLSYFLVFFYKLPHQQKVKQQPVLIKTSALMGFAASRLNYIHLVTTIFTFDMLKFRCDIVCWLLVASVFHQATIKLHYYLHICNRVKSWNSKLNCRELMIVENIRLVCLLDLTPDFGVKSNAK